MYSRHEREIRAFKGGVILYRSEEGGEGISGAFSCAISNLACFGLCLPLFEGLRATAALRALGMISIDILMEEWL